MLVADRRVNYAPERRPKVTYVIKGRQGTINCRERDSAVKPDQLIRAPGPFQRLPAYSRSLLRIATLAVLLALGTILVYMTGGTGYAFPYVMLVPAVLAAAWFGLLPALAAGAVAGLLVGPLMPLDVGADIAQPTGNWVARLLLYLLISGFAGLLFQRLQLSNDAHLQALRTDSRSGLPNTSALEEDLAELLQRRPADAETGAPVALVFVRVLDLADILEAFGPDASDQVVVHLAGRIRDRAAPIHDVYRFSGSELLILAPLDAEHDIEALIGAVRAIGEEPLDVREVPVRVQLATGSHVSTAGIPSPDDLIRRARTALFAAIEEAEFYRAYDPVYESRTRQRVQLIAQVRSGLSERQFELYYQPRIRLDDMQPTGAEALIRWHGMDGRLILPGHFMPKVEETSLIAQVTRFVVTQASEFLRLHPEESASVNFAVRNLQDHALLNDLPRIMERAGVAPSRLDIEITERALIRNPNEVRAVLRDLREQGFGISIDDFGTGYSSFEYLTRLPISGLKIDRTFVVGLGADPAAADILRCLVGMSHALGLETTIEGIETERQRDIVQDIGGEFAQGFHFARPMPAEQYAAWLEEMRTT